MSKSFFKVGKLNGKGAAAVIVFCLTAVAAAGVYTYNKSEVTKEKINSSNESVHTEDYLNAQAEKQDVPKNETVHSENVPVQNNTAVTEENTVSQTDDKTEVETETQKSAFENESAVESGILVRPADGDIICEFSDGELIKSETLNVWKTHDGIDIAADEGTPIRSVAQGVVTAVYDDPLWGNCISIEHDGGYESFYMGVSDTIYVSANETVNAGTEIAEVGNTADAEALEDEHIHFALKKDGNWVDPADVLSGLGS